MALVQCAHPQMKHVACADAYLDRFLCTRCGHPIVLPRMIPKPQLRWLKACLRHARSMRRCEQRHWFEVPAAAKDVPYIMFFLSWAGYMTTAPEGSALLFCKATFQSSSPQD